MGSLDCTKYALWTINMLSPLNLVKLQYKFNLLREKSPYTVIKNIDKELEKFWDMIF
jgi:hypothetical protein